MSNPHNVAEKELKQYLRGLSDDQFMYQMKKELDHLDYLESTKRDKRRIEKQRRICEVYTNVAAQ